MTEPGYVGRAAELLDAALTAFLEEGYSAVGVREITARAGVSHGTFYNYFESKRHLLEALVDVCFSHLRAPLVAEVEQLDTVMTVAGLDAAVLLSTLAVLEEVAGRIDAYRFLLLEVPGVDAESTEQFARLFRRMANDADLIIDRARASGLINEKLDQRFIGEAWIGYIVGVIAGMINDVDVATPEESARVIANTVLYGAFG